MKTKCVFNLGLFLFTILALSILPMRAEATDCYYDNVGGTVRMGLAYTDLEGKNASGYLMSFEGDTDWFKCSDKDNHYFDRVVARFPNLRVDMRKDLSIVSLGGEYWYAKNRGLGVDLVYIFDRRWKVRPVDGSDRFLAICPRWTIQGERYYFTLRVGPQLWTNDKELGHSIHSSQEIYSDFVFGIKFGS